MNGEPTKSDAVPSNPRALIEELVGYVGVISGDKIAFSRLLQRIEAQLAGKPSAPISGPNLELAWETFLLNRNRDYGTREAFVAGWHAGFAERSAHETSGDGLSIDETRFLAALADVKPPAGSPGAHTAYGRTLIERVWDEYQRLKDSERASEKASGEPT